jgi:hypothetical protein
MFNSENNFLERRMVEFSDASLTKSEKHVVKVHGISRHYFTAIIQFLYTDTFYQADHSLSYFLRLMLYADYFLIDRLKEICQ